ncbi:hypothetical protein ACFQMM_03475 [Saliphagus sp. GCM10025308]
MTTQSADEIPFMQRIYDRIWVLAILAFAFFLFVYVIWGQSTSFRFRWGEP